MASLPIENPLEPLAEVASDELAARNADEGPEALAVVVPLDAKEEDIQPKEAPKADDDSKEAAIAEAAAASQKQACKALQGTLRHFQLGDEGLCHRSKLAHDVGVVLIQGFMRQGALVIATGYFMSDVIHDACRYGVRLRVNHNIPRDHAWCIHDVLDTDSDMSAFYLSELTELRDHDLETMFDWNVMMPMSYDSLHYAAAPIQLARAEMGGVVLGDLVRVGGQDEAVFVGLMRSEAGDVYVVVTVEQASKPRTKDTGKRGTTSKRSPGKAAAQGGQVLCVAQAKTTLELIEGRASVDQIKHALQHLGSALRFYDGSVVVELAREKAKDLEITMVLPQSQQEVEALRDGQKKRQDAKIHQFVAQLVTEAVERTTAKEQKRERAPKTPEVICAVQLQRALEKCTPPGAWPQPQQDATLSRTEKVGLCRVWVVDG